MGAASLALPGSACAGCGLCFRLETDQEVVDMAELFRRKGKIYAVLEADGTLYKTIHGSRHILRKDGPAICFDIELIEWALSKGAIRAKVKDVETGAVYTASFLKLYREGQVVDMGHGLQLRCPLSLFERRKYDGAPPE